MSDPLPSGAMYEVSATSWVARVLALTLLICIVIIGIILGFIVAIPLFVFGVLLYAYIRIKMYFKRARDPGGPLDERRNVRVVDRDE